jgi:hypothetical protein
MNAKFHRFATSCAVGLGLFVLPPILGVHLPLSSDNAYAEKGAGHDGGNGHDSGNGHDGGDGNGGGNGHSGGSGHDSGSGHDGNKDHAGGNGFHNGGNGHSGTTGHGAGKAHDGNNGQTVGTDDGSKAPEDHGSPDIVVPSTVPDPGFLNTSLSSVLVDARIAAAETSKTAAEATQAALAVSPEYQHALLDARAAGEALSLNPTIQTLLDAKTADAAVARAAAEAIAMDPTVAVAEEAAADAAIAAARAETNALMALEAATNNSVTSEVRPEAEALLLDHSIKVGTGN